MARSGPGLYSRVVAVLKIGLPLIALAMLSSLFLTRTDDAGGEISFSRADLAALGSGLRVDNPTFAGSTRRDDRFEFEADVVVPDAAPPTRASIEGLRGRIDFAAGARVEVSARAAELEMEAHALELRDEARVATSDGLVVLAPRMSVDLRSGALSATGGVETTGPMGEITSGDLSITPAEGGEAPARISFGQGVRLVYYPAEEAE